MVSRPFVTPCSTDVLRTGAPRVPRPAPRHLPVVAVHDLPQPRVRRIAASVTWLPVPAVDDDRLGDRTKRARRNERHRSARHRARPPRGHRSARRGSPRAPLKPKHPVLADQGLSERAMALAFDELKPRALVDATRRDEDVVRPKGELAISRCARETDALVDES